MHVVDPTRYPLASGARYVPSTFTLEQALAFEQTVGLSNIVLVQPSIYGNDNTCMLDALRALGPRRGRAVVAFEPQSIPRDTLKEWHELGVRGVRVNFSSLGLSPDAESLRSLLHRYAEDCRVFNWVIQLYMPMNMITLLEPIVPELGVRVCIDHMGHPSLPSAVVGSVNDIPGLQSLVNLLKSGSTFVKMSAPYRLSKTSDYTDLDPIASELMKFANSRVVFATDWPHTRFEGLDIKPWVDRVLDWCDGDEGLVERLFRGNAEDLWDVKIET